MKYWGTTFFMFVVCACAWGQGANQFSFVSVLNTPRASFEEIRTTNPDKTTTFSADTYFNVGSLGSSSAGSIQVEGNPIEVTNLQMQDNTRLNLSDSNRRWLVDTLTINPNGTVAMGHLIAGRVSLGNFASHKRQKYS